MSVANAVMNAVVQAILLGLIPFGWWLATARSKASFSSGSVLRSRRLRMVPVFGSSL